jgi:hypothetical protein
MEVRQKIVNRNRIRNSPIMNNSLGLQKKTPVINFDNCDISDEDVSIRDEEKCCVCGQHNISKFSLLFTMWTYNFRVFSNHFFRHTIREMNPMTTDNTLFPLHKQNHIKKPGKYALHTYLELKSSPLSKLGYTIFLISSQIVPSQIGIII